MSKDRSELSPSALAHAFVEVQGLSSRGAPVEQLVPKICKKVVELLGCDRSAVLLLDRGGFYRWTYNWGSPPELAELFSAMEIPRSSATFQRLEKNGSLLISNDALSDTDLAEVAKAAGLTGIAMALMVDSGGSPVGVLTAEYCQTLGAFGDLESVVLLAAAGLVQSAILADRLQKEATRLELDVAKAQDGERRRLSIELHDNALQDAYAVCLRLETMQVNLGSGPIYDELTSVIATCRNSAEGMRILTNEVHPESTASAGLEAVLHQQLTRSGENQQWRFTFDDVTTIKPRAEAAVTFSSVANQAMSNIRNHAGATEVNMALTTVGKGTTLSIHDNGCGFDPDTAHPGHLGLVSMRERAELHGGRLTISSVIGKGTTIKTWLPHAVGNATREN